MESNLKLNTLRAYGQKIIDLSKRNRLLKYPAKARSVSFGQPLEQLLESGNLGEFFVEFIHDDVRDQDIKKTAEDSSDTQENEGLPIERILLKPPFLRRVFLVLTKFKF